MGEGADGARTGGLVLAGSLVWSRAYSDGVNQRVKLLYTLGEWSPAAPQKRGVWLGTVRCQPWGSLTLPCIGSRKRRGQDQSRQSYFRQPWHARRW